MVLAASTCMDWNIYSLIRPVQVAYVHRSCFMTFVNWNCRRYWTHANNQRQWRAMEEERRRRRREFCGKNCSPKNLINTADHAKLLNIYDIRCFEHCRGCSDIQKRFGDSIASHTRNFIVPKNLLSAFNLGILNASTGDGMHFAINSRLKIEEWRCAFASGVSDIISHYYAPFSDLRRTRTVHRPGRRRRINEWISIRKTVYAIH